MKLPILKLFMLTSVAGMQACSTSPTGKAPVAKAPEQADANTAAAPAYGLAGGPGVGGFTCQQQKSWGKCDQSWMHPVCDEVCSPSAPKKSVPSAPASTTCIDLAGNRHDNADLVLGQCIDRSTSYYADHGDIYQRGKKLRINGINWFGFEGSYLGLHGLWSGRSLHSMVDQIKSLGLNALRIPLAPEALDSWRQGKDGYSSPLAQLKDLLDYTGKQGIYVLLDLHNCSMNLASTDKPGPGLGSCSFYTESQWHGNLQTLAGLAATYQNVLGIDLFNEPYGPNWHDWKGEAERAATAIMQVNPRVLIFVEGVGSQQPYGQYDVYWGENLYEAGTDVPQIPLGRLVFSPHVYGPSVSEQSYLSAANFPANMPAIWDEHYGYLAKKGYTLVFGEFGGTYTGRDQIWQDAFVEYLKKSGTTNTFYWSLNPNSGDTKGLLLDDWRTVNWGKMGLLQRLMH